MTLLKINRLLPIYISIVPLKFEVDIQSKSKVRVRKPKNPIWPPGGHFESDIAENQQASAYGHHQHAYEIWNWNSKANLTYAPETMSSTDRRTDGQTDGRTRWIQYTPPPTLLGGGIKNPDGFISNMWSDVKPLETQLGWQSIHQVPSHPFCNGFLWTSAVLHRFPLWWLMVRQLTWV